jgi:adenylosuccinate lyase
MQANVERLGGLVFSQKVLLALTQKGISRENAYVIVQRSAMAVWDNLGSLTFKDSLLSDPEIQAHFTAADLDTIFDYGDYTRHADYILNRVFQQAA